MTTSNHSQADTEVSWSFPPHGTTAYPSCVTGHKYLEIAQVAGSVQCRRHPVPQCILYSSMTETKAKKEIFERKLSGCVESALNIRKLLLAIGKEERISPMFFSYWDWLIWFRICIQASCSCDFYPSPLVSNSAIWTSKTRGWNRTQHKIMVSPTSTTIVFVSAVDHPSDLVDLGSRPRGHATCCSKSPWFSLTEWCSEDFCPHSLRRSAIQWLKQLRKSRSSARSCEDRDLQLPCSVRIGYSLFTLTVQMARDSFPY